MPPEGYVLLPGTPTVHDYMRLRADAGLTPRTEEQSSLALPGSWAGCHVVETAGGETVGMGRLIGDGGWYFRRAAPADAFVSLMADTPGRRLYERHGFTERRDLSIGMAMWLGRVEAGGRG